MLTISFDPYADMSHNLALLLKGQFIVWRIARGDGKSPGNAGDGPFKEHDSRNHSYRDWFDDETF